LGRAVRRWGPTSHPVSYQRNALLVEVHKPQILTNCTSVRGNSCFHMVIPGELQNSNLLLIFQFVDNSVTEIRLMGVPVPVLAGQHPFSALLQKLLPLLNRKTAQIITICLLARDIPGTTHASFCPILCGRTAAVSLKLSHSVGTHWRLRILQPRHQRYGGSRCEE